MPKILVRQQNSDSTETLVYEGEKREVILVTGESPWVYKVEVCTKDKMYEQLKIEREEKHEVVEKEEETK